MTSEKITGIYSDPSWSVLRQGWNNFHACGLHHSAYGPTIYLYDEFAMLTPRRSHQLCLSVSHRHACVPGHFSHVWLWTWTVARQVPLSMGFSRQESWSGLPCPPPGNLPHPGIEPRSPALQVNSLLSEPRYCCAIHIQGEDLQASLHTPTVTA